IHRDYEAALEAALREGATEEDRTRLNNVATFLSGFLLTHQQRVLAVLHAEDKASNANRTSEAPSTSRKTA
ncbi:MAG: hypothetical protein WDA16_08330, partial [Candidatus Thermoplasmatota archaeon]